MTHSTNKDKYFFEINKDEDNLFYFQLKDKNGKIYLGSYFYKKKNKCEKRINSVIRNSKNEEHFIIDQIINKKWIVFMEDGNGKIIANSPCFETKEELESFIKDLKSLTLETLVIDKTE